MNQSIFTTAGGFPLKGERLQELQEAYAVFNALGFIIGNNSILDGCVSSGGNTSDGYVFYNGEVLPFKGGPSMSTVILVTENVNREFKNGNVNPVYQKRHMAFGAGAGSVAWANFKRGTATRTIADLLAAKASMATTTALEARIQVLEAKAAPFLTGGTGAMVLWRKPANQIPAGWAEVTDWRGRLPMGWNPDDSDFNAVNTTGGSKTKTVTVNLPTNTYTASGDGTSSGAAGRLIVSSGLNENSEVLESLRKASYDGPTASGTVNVLPPYRIVMFIEYVGT